MRGRVVEIFALSEANQVRHFGGVKGAAVEAWDDADGDTVFVYRSEPRLKSPSFGFCWTNGTGWATVGLDETNQPARGGPTT